jgi:hypothetical protein
MVERLRIALTLFVLLAAPAAFATTIVPPADLGQLARISGSVAFAEALESWVEPGETLPQTVTRFRLAERVAGADPGAIFEVREPGGRLGESGAAIAGSPRFQDGRRYLLFLDPAPGGRWRSKTLAYGLLEEDAANGLLRPLAEARRLELKQLRKTERVGSYHRQALLGHLRQVAKGARWDPAQAGQAQTAAAPSVVAAGDALVNQPADCDFITDDGDGLPVRWFDYETGAATSTVMATTPGQPGLADGGVSAVQQGTGAWTNHPDSVIRLTYGGTQPRNITCSGNFDSQSGAVVFDDPCNDLADLSGCVGTLAYGGVFYGLDSRSYDGQPWHPARSLFVVVNNGAQCIGDTAFKETLTHELGHTVGFGHHTPANPADATMSAFLKNDGRGASIAITDKVCASFAYHTFLDVTTRSPYWRFIEAIENAGVTAGCGAGNYCPTQLVTRGQMAAFLLLAKQGPSYTPPACTSPRFTDVPCSNPLAPWINELAARGVTGGCGNGKYCPSDPVTRDQMAVFLLATKEGSGYRPAACTTPRFNDMPCSSPFAPWVNELVSRGVTAGCGNGAYCPKLTVSRDQMSVFLTGTFALPAPPAP